MVRRKRARNNRKVRGRPQACMTAARIAEVKTWLDRMGAHLDRAINLSKRMSLEDLDESSDLFWALVKYAENVQESVVQLDRVNAKVYPALVELGEGTWKGLKGMRSRLAHAFWNIDAEILWATVTEEFPKLRALLSTIVVVDQPVNEQRESASIRLTAEQVFALPTAVPDTAPSPGNSIVALVFVDDGQVCTIRISNEGGRSFSVRADPDAPVTVFAR